jgi:hypothetical protein
MKNSVKNLLNLIGTLKCMRHPNQIHETQTLLRHGSTEGKLNLGCYTPILAFHLYFHFHRHIKS